MLSFAVRSDTQIKRQRRNKVIPRKPIAIKNYKKIDTDIENKYSYLLHYSVTDIILYLHYESKYFTRSKYVYIHTSHTSLKLSMEIRDDFNVRHFRRIGFDYLYYLFTL